jgi:ADP-ribosylglycohydrolase
MPAGAVTDDTEQAILLGKLLVKGHGTIDPLTVTRSGAAVSPTRAELDQFGGF